jgi:O-antigen/teichoic acid export membrane protein
MTPTSGSAALRKNVAANYAGKLWSIASVYLFVPLYVRLLGVDAYGVIAFHSALLGLLFIADAGLSSAFAREMARRSEDKAHLRTVLRSLELVYLAIAGVCALAVALASGWIAENWLRPTASLPPDLLRLCIILMGISSSIQVAMSLYNGGFMGADKHPRANAFQVGFSFVRSGLVVLPIYFMPDLKTYFAWQAATALTFIVWMRHSLWHMLGGRQTSRFSIDALGTTWHFAAGMLGIAIISAVNTQVDKLVVSKLLSLQELARFSIASLLAQIPSMITLPIAVSLLPRMTRWAGAQDLPEIRRTYLRYSFIIGSLACTSGGVLALFPAELVRLWTRNDMLSASVGSTATLLVLGHILLAMQYMPYHLALAFGHNRTNLRIGAVFLVVTPVLLVFLTRSHGIAGAAVPWLFMNFVATLLLGVILTSKFLPGDTPAWFSKALFWPLSACLPTVLIVKLIEIYAGFDAGTWLIAATLAGLAMAGSCLAAYRVAFPVADDTARSSA